MWQNKPYPGLRHPAMPKKDLTPNEAFAALHAVAPTVNATLTRDDYIGLLPVAYRSIQPYGINFESLHFDSPGLHPLRGMKSGLPAPANGRWEVRYDPYRLQSIFVRDHRRGAWIEARWTMAGQSLAPFSLDVLNAARKALERRGSVPGVDVLAEINRIQTNGAATVKERKAAKRNAATTPALPPEPASGPGDGAGHGAPVLPAGPRKRRAARRIDDEE